MGALTVNAGLPLRDRTRFEPVATVAASPRGRPVLVGGSEGLYRSTDRNLRTWAACDHRVAAEVVTIPPTWLLCSGEHRIEVVTRAAAGRGPPRPTTPTTPTSPARATGAPAMHRDAIQRLLPTVFQLSARPGSPLDAALHVMSDLHEPDERLLAAIEHVFDPYRTPDALVPWLTRWSGSTGWWPTSPTTSTA